MVLAFGAMEPLAVAAAALSRGVLVAAAGVVVVLAILLVFVMVLRGAGSSRQKASGLDYDAQQGPFGQPHAPANDPAQMTPWAGGQPDARYNAMDQGFDQGFGQGRPAAQPQQAQNWGQQFAEPAQANTGTAWSDAPGGRWNNDQMAPAGGQMGANADWGAPQQGQANASPWDAPAAGAAPQWNGGAAGPSTPAARGGAPANPWDAPAAPPSQPSWGGQAAAPSQPAWGAQAAAPSQPSWGGQAAPSQPSWDAPAAPPSQPSWGGQAAAPSQPAWGAQAAAPSQPAWDMPAAPPSQPSWGAQPDAGMMRSAPRAGHDGPRLVERKSDGSGREFDLRKERLTIGRHRESDVFLEDLAVSRLHTTVSHDASGRFILRDENSANGTYVNGQRVSEHLLKDGDEVQVGQTVLVFQQR